MIEHNVGNFQVERVDDIPLLLSFLYRMGIREILDKNYPTHGHWAGELSFGTVACVWLSYILSEGDHRLSHLEEWVSQHQVMLESCLSQSVRPLDFQDDRLGAMLDVLSDAAKFSEFETALNGNLLRVYQLAAETSRIDRDDE